MEHFIGWDAHKHYSVFVAMGERGKFSPAWRTNHETEEVRQHLKALPAGSQIAIEASGGCYWLIDEMLAHGHRPVLANPHESKMRMGKRKKTDRLDAQSLAMMLSNGTLPEVWIPPSELRDRREPMRLRMVLVRMRTQLKNRIHGVLTRFNVQISASDLFGKQGREDLAQALRRLPPQTRASVEQALRVLDSLEQEIEASEARIGSMLNDDAATRLLDSLPCVGPILSAVLALEIGSIERFPTAGQLASYAGLVPTVHSSGGHTRMGPVSRKVNRTLKWAFVEAANVIAMQRKKRPLTHVAKLYERVKARKNHQKATVAVARHLAEAAFAVLHKQEAYREPKLNRDRAPERTGSKRTASLTHE